MMKKVGMVLAALTLSSAFALAAPGKSIDPMEEINLKACTADGQTATLIADVAGNAKDANGQDIDLRKLARDAFVMTAQEMTGAEMTAGHGFDDNKGLEKFIKNIEKLLDKNNASVSSDFSMGVGSSRVPTITPGCALSIPFHPLAG